MAKDSAQRRGRGRGEWPRELDPRFDEVELLSRGKISSVYRAREKSLDRSVAVRVLHSHVQENQTVRQRFRREFAAARRLDHPGILQTYDVIEEEEVVALVMEYVEGRTVREWVEEEGAMALDEAVALLVEAAEALDHAHQRGVLHRDLSAHHLMVTSEGKAKLVGFGLARVEELVGLTMHTRVLGAMEAMAPERLLGMSYDGRADIYSLGVVAKELLTGEPPRAMSFSDSLLRAGESGSGEEEPGGAPEEMEGLPETVRYALERALASDVSARFVKATQFGRALKGEWQVGRLERWGSLVRRRCSSCETMVMPGLSQCVQCGHAFHRLIEDQSPGEWMVVILSDRDVFEKDVWFEANTASQHLSEEQFQGLMVFLSQFEDTEAAASGHWWYRYPPYALLANLSWYESRRIAGEIQKQGVPARADTRVPPNPWAGTDVTRNRVVVNANLAMLALVLSAALFTVASLISVLIPAAMFGLIALGAILGVGAMLLVGRYWIPEVEVYGIEESNQGLRSVMISSEAWLGLGSWKSSEVLPEGTAERLRALGDPATRREVMELLGLILDRGLGGEMRAEEIQTLVDEALEAGAELEKQSSGEEASQAELLGELEALEVRIEEAETAEGAEKWIEEKARVTEAFKRRDEREQRRTLLQARLMAVRGRLLETRMADEESLERGEREVDEFAEVRLLLSAAREVDAIAGVQEPSGVEVVQ